MQKIPLRLAQPGMFLAQPVVKADGRVLVGAGIELTSSLLERLGTAGVRGIVVEGASASGFSTEQRVLARLDHLFRKQEGDQFMSALQALLRAYFERRAAGEAIENGE